MIAKIRRGKKLSGLVAYLLGPGEHNEHKDRHILAGSPTVMREMWLEHFDGPGDDELARETALAVASEVDIPRRLYGTQVRMKAKPVAVGVGGRELGLDVVEPAGRGEKGTYKDAPVWHCVLALMPEEELTDARWQQIAESFMDRMGFTGTADGKRAQARWVAVRHGLSGADGEGQDHIHIAASLVREDGSKVSTYDYGPGKAKGDWNRADEVCGELEHEFGLKVLASRKEGGGLSENSRAELERQKRLGTPETERERLRRMVRAHAVAADSESEFVTGLREAGIAIRPRYATGGTTEVTGYSVRFQRGGTEVGPWMGGGKLAGDLSLSALREQQWDDSSQARQDALAVWKNRAASSSGRAGAGVTGIDAWTVAAGEIEQWRERLAQIPAGDRAQWSYLAGQAAGVFAAWSETFEGEEPGAFAAAATELTRSAQTARRADRWQPPAAHRPSAFADVAQLLLAHSRTVRPRIHARPARAGDDPTTEMAVLLLALMVLLLLVAIAIVAAVARAHRERGELSRAVAVNDMHRRHLEPVRASWQSELQARRDQWDRDAADVFTAAAGRVAQRIIGEQPEILGAARGPLTSPTTLAPAEARSKFYSEFTDTEKERWRMTRAVDAGFASRDLRPRAWTDEVLAAELTHRRAEVQALVADIETRSTGDGPHTREARAENVALTARAAAIPDAQQAHLLADQLAADWYRAEARRERLAQELEATGRHKVLARKKLTTELAEATARAADAAAGAATAKKNAGLASDATGEPASEWNEILRQASEPQQRQRLSSAQQQDARQLGEDRYSLDDLQRDLARVETEHARRSKLTPAQREREDTLRAQNKLFPPDRGPARPSPGRGASMPFRPPDRGRNGPDRGGFGL